MQWPPQWPIRMQTAPHFALWQSAQTQRPDASKLGAKTGRGHHQSQKQRERERERTNMWESNSQYITLSNWSQADGPSEIIAITQQTQIMPAIHAKWCYDLKLPSKFKKLTSYEFTEFKFASYLPALTSNEITTSYFLPNLGCMHLGKSTKIPFLFLSLCSISRGKSAHRIVGLGGTSGGQLVQPPAQWKPRLSYSLALVTSQNSSR